MVRHRPVRISHRGLTICRLDMGNSPANTSRVKSRLPARSLLLAAVLIGAVTVRPQQSAAPPQMPEPQLHLTPAEIKIYQRAKTLVNWNSGQIHNSPFLENLRLARDQGQLPMILERVGQTATRLFHDFPQIACDEEVVSEKRSGTSSVTERHNFRYIVIPRSAGAVPAFYEYRTELNGNPLDAFSPGGGTMITSNYASTWLYLSPADQHDSHFRYFGTQTIRSRECHVVGFAQDPESFHRAGKLIFGDQSIAVLVQGLAWIDSQTFQLLRIKIWLLAPRTDVGLRSHDSTVDFYPVQPSGSEKVLWLPRDVTVQTGYLGLWLRNTHHCSNFQLFRVESTIKTGK